MTAAFYYVATPGTGRHKMASLDAAYRFAYRLLTNGAPDVQILQMKLTADCWGPATGEDGILHHFVPAAHQIAPEGGHGSNSVFPPYMWRQFMACDVQASLPPGSPSHGY